MRTPEHTTAKIFPRYLKGEVVADSAACAWPGIFVRRYRLPRVVDGLFVPATAEPLIACVISGVAEFQERDIGGTWLAPRELQRGDLFVTLSKTPYEVRWRSPFGSELDVVHIHLAIDQCRSAFESVYKARANRVEVIEFFGRDEALANLCFACTKMLSTQTAGTSKRVAAIAHLSAIHIAEKYTNIASQKAD
jgi:AraC family transcriptional regulator